MFKTLFKLCFDMLQSSAQGSPALGLEEHRPAFFFLSLPPSNIPAFDGCHNQASAELDDEVNQVGLSKVTWKTGRTVFHEDWIWETPPYLTLICTKGINSNFAGFSLST